MTHHEPYNIDPATRTRQPDLQDQPTTSTQLSQSADSEQSATESKKRPSMLREIIETLLLALIIFVAVRAVVLNFRVDGLSMASNLEDGDMLLVNRNAYFHFDQNAVIDWIPFVDAEEGEDIVYPFDPPERGDIVVFDPPSDNEDDGFRGASADRPYIKRVIGLPGETVEIRNNEVYIDGVELEEPYLDGERTFCGSPGEACDPVTVPEGHVFVLGDNRDNSEDSRALGPIPVDNIIGKAWLIYWPDDNFGLVPHHEYPEIPDAA